MAILLTGADGYIGWPTALRIADRSDDRIILADNFGRRKWVDEIGSTSAVPVRSMDERLGAAKSVLGLDNLSFVEGNLTEKAFVDNLLAIHQPDTVEHFENPRDEDETHKMEMENDRYIDLIGKQAQSFEEGVRDIFETLNQYEETISSHVDRFLPGVLEDRMESEEELKSEIN